MRKNQDRRMFGEQRGDDLAAAPADHTAASHAPPGKQPHARRTVGLTEQRLRAANQQSWMTTRTGWVRMFRRFMPGNRA